MFPTCLPDFRRGRGAQQQSWRWQFGRACTRAHLYMSACTSARMINRLLCDSFKILLTETLSKCVSVEGMSRGFSWTEMACSFQDISWRCTMPLSPHTNTHTHTSSSLQFLWPCDSIIIYHIMNSVNQKEESMLPVLVLGLEWNWQWWESNKTLQFYPPVSFRTNWWKFISKCALLFKYIWIW